MSRRRAHLLTISSDLAEALVLARMKVGVHVEAEVFDDEVAWLESSLGLKVPEPLLAWVAALRRDLADLARLTDEAQDMGMVSGYIAFARTEGAFWCARGGKRRGDLEVGRWGPGDEEPTEECAMGRFVRRFHGLVGGALSDAEREELREGLADFRAVVRKRVQEPRHVVHPKFGRGLVIREIHDGNHKLEIEFDSGRRTILARFVTEEDQPRPRAA